jgi:hypothetical protein
MSSPAGSADAAGHDERRGVDHVVISEGARSAGDTAVDRGPVDLELGDAQLGPLLKQRVHVGNAGLGFGEPDANDRGDSGIVLTRARQGMVIFVPPGAKRDRTRSPGFYEGVSRYLTDLGVPQV